EHPDDDAPRLVYSDWLEEHGDEDDRRRAEFIRVQIELARLDEDDPRRLALANREAALLDTHRDVWVRELPAWARKRVKFQRGFPSRIDCTVAGFLKNGAAL